MNMILDPEEEAAPEIHGFEIVTYEAKDPNQPDQLNARIKIGEKVLGCSVSLPPDWRTNPKSFQLALRGMELGLMSIVEKELKL